MRLASLKLAVVAVLALGTVGLVANQVFAAVPTVKGIGKVFQVVNFTASPTGAGFVSQVVEVPDKQTMVVTDVIFCNDEPSAPPPSSASLRCSPTGGGSQITIMAPVTLAAGQTFSHSFGQGIECGPGTKLVVVLEQGNPSNVTGWHITVSGYLRKGG
jgi:hypothetical protein